MSVKNILTSKMLLAGTVAKAADAAAEICEEGPLLGKPYDQQLVLDRIKRLMASARGPIS